MPSLTESAAKFAKKAKDADRFPLWLPMLLPVGALLAAGYIAFMMLLAPASQPQQDSIPPAGSLAASDPLGGAETATAAGPATVALGAAGYMVTGDDALLPPGVDGSSLPVVRSWDPSLVDLSLLDYTIQSDAAIATVAANGPSGEAEVVRLSLRVVGEVWVVASQ